MARAPSPRPPSPPLQAPPPPQAHPRSPALPNQPTAPSPAADGGPPVPRAASKVMRKTRMRTSLRGRCRGSRRRRGGGASRKRLRTGHLACASAFLPCRTLNVAFGQMDRLEPFHALPRPGSPAPTRSFPPPWSLTHRHTLAVLSTLLFGPSATLPSSDNDSWLFPTRN